MSWRASAEGDVHSYGILLLEMLTGRRPTSEAFRDGFTLPDYVEMSFPERVMEVMDPHLIQQMEADGRDHILESIISVLRIGVTCSNQAPRDHMEMGDAVNQLHSIRNLLLRLDHGGKGTSQSHL